MERKKAELSNKSISEEPFEPSRKEAEQEQTKYTYYGRRQNTDCDYVIRMARLFGPGCSSELSKTNLLTTDVIWV